MYNTCWPFLTKWCINTSDTAELFDIHIEFLVSKTLIQRWKVTEGLLRLCKESIRNSGISKFVIHYITRRKSKPSLLVKLLNDVEWMPEDRPYRPRSGLSPSSLNIASFSFINSFSYLLNLPHLLALLLGCAKHIQWAGYAEDLVSFKTLRLKTVASRFKHFITFIVKLFSNLQNMKLSQQVGHTVRSSLFPSFCSREDIRCPRSDSLPWL